MRRGPSARPAPGHQGMTRDLSVPNGDRVASAHRVKPARVVNGTRIYGGPLT